MAKNKNVNKTNAMRILDGLKISYTYTEYEVDPNHLDGGTVAEKVGKLPDEVFKTLVTQGNSKNYLVFVIPVNKELDLKKAAQAAGEKSVEMIAVKDINKVTGYIRGGCCPIGMKKDYQTFIDQSGQNLAEITCSAGKIGLQITLASTDLLNAAQATWVDITK